MISAEQLVNDLQKEVAKLNAALAEAEQHIKDFEELAKVWSKSYKDLNDKYKRDIGNANQTISQLEDDLEELRNRE